MQTLKAGHVIRVTAVKPQLSTGITVGQLLTVAEDPRQPVSMYDGHTWIESDGGAKGWVKYELVEVFRSADVYQLRESLRAHMNESLVEAAARLRKNIEFSQNRTIELSDRIGVLESEVLRLSTPPGSSFVMRPDGKPGLGVSPYSDQTVVHPQKPAESQKDELHARAGRQRREIRRLNQSQRMMKLEVTVLRRTNEDLVGKLLEQNKYIRLLEAK